MIDRSSGYSVSGAVPTRRPQTRQSLTGDLGALGVSEGDALLVHASLRSLGWVCGGATAVVEALVDAVGPTGTVAVPTHTAGNSDPARWHRTGPAPVPADWWPAIRDALPPFDPATSPGMGMGAVSEAVRTWPGALRSGHPQTSFVALGPAAGHVVANHDRTCHLGERSPLARLAEHDAKVLLLGVGFAVCTAFHLAEYRLPDPPIRTYSCVVATPAGRTWFDYPDVALDDGDFAALGADLEGTGAVAVGPAGAAQARLFRLAPAVDHAVGWLAAHRISTADGPGHP
jgi:aminoglycoside 3-N-acetyltransferase